MSALAAGGSIRGGCVTYWLTRNLYITNKIHFIRLRFEFIELLLLFVRRLLRIWIVVFRPICPMEAYRVHACETVESPSYCDFGSISILNFCSAGAAVAYSEGVETIVQCSPNRFTEFGLRLKCVRCVCVCGHVCGVRTNKSLRCQLCGVSGTIRLLASILCAGIGRREKETTESLTFERLSIAYHAQVHYASHLTENREHKQSITSINHKFILVEEI